MIKRLSLYLLAMILMTSPIFSSSQEFMYEKNLTDIAQNAMDAMFGKGNFVIRVKVDMTQPQYSVKYTQQSSPKLNQNQPKNEKEVYILPGVPALKNLAPDAFNQLPYDSVTTLTEPQVKKISVFVLANKDFPRTQARKAEPVLEDILGLKQGRDVIKFDYRPFYYNPSSSTQNITIIPGKEKLFTYQNLFFILILILLVTFIILYIRYGNLAAQSKGDSSGGGSTNVSVNPNLELPRGGAQSGGSSSVKINRGDGMKVFFDFITPENVDDFIYLINKDGLKAEYIAMITAFLDSDLSSKLISTLAVEDQAFIAAHLIDQRLCNRELLEKLEKKYKNALECFMGGSHNFEAIFDKIDGSHKKEILSVLEQRQPDVYRKVRQKMILFDDIKSLTDDELKMVLSESKLELLAQALVSVDQSIYQRVDDNLTSEARAMTAQYLELKSKSTNRKDIEAAQDYILKVMRRLDDAGKIDLSSKIV